MPGNFISWRRGGDSPRIRGAPGVCRANPYTLGGEAGIRTLGPISGTTVFKTVPLNHSGTSPDKIISKL
jgi:hypothetical protein